MERVTEGENYSEKWERVESQRALTGLHAERRVFRSRRGRRGVVKRRSHREKARGK